MNCVVSKGIVTGFLTALDMDKLSLASTSDKVIGNTKAPSLGLPVHKS